MNEQKDRKTDKKNRQEKKILFEHFSICHAAFCTVFCLCVGNKTVRVGYFPYANFQEGGFGEHKQGAGYEYLQKFPT